MLRHGLRHGLRRLVFSHHQLAHQRQPPFPTKVRPPPGPLVVCWTRRFFSSSSSSSSSKEEDDLARDITKVESGLLQRTSVEVGTTSTTDSGGGDLMYQGEYMENWEELLKEARAAYPSKGGKQRYNYKRRFRHKMKVIAEQHRVLKQQRIAKHEREMLDRHKRAVERKAGNWFGPILRC